MQRVHVRLVSEDPAWCAERARELAPVADIVVTGSVRLAGLAGSGAAAVVVVDGGPNLDNALEAIGRQTRGDGASAYVLALGPEADAAATYPRAALAGIRVVLPPGCELPELTEGIYRAADCIAGGTGTGEGAGSGSDRVIATFGTKGGAGKTTLAVNLAVALAKRGLRTALCDLHFDWGTVAVQMRGAPPRAFSELLSECQRLDADLLQSFMARHSTGVHVLPAPPKPEMAEFVNADHVAAIARAARDGFDVVVLDLPPSFPNTVFPALEAADHLLAVTTPDVPALRNMRAALAVLELLQLGAAKVHLVLNRANQALGIRRADVEATLGLPVWAALPGDDATVLRAANEGLPVADVSPSSRYGRAVSALARQLVPDAYGRNERRAEGRQVAARPARAAGPGGA